MSIKAISRDNVHLICSAQVILSPAIALKELLENALDAKATNIEVKLQEYGTKMITVVDNGCGIKEADFVGLSKYMNILSVFLFFQKLIVFLLFISVQASYQQTAKV